MIQYVCVNIVLKLIISKNKAMIQVTINLYSLNELSDKAKEKAINEHGDFLESVGFDYEDENGEMKMDYTRPTEEEIADSIEANEYIFYANGDMANICQFVGAHPRAGEFEFTLNGETYTS